jgi:hypothetical protein
MKNLHMFIVASMCHHILAPFSGSNVQFTIDKSIFVLTDLYFAEKSAESSTNPLMKKNTKNPTLWASGIYNIRS